MYGIVKLSHYKVNNVCIQSHSVHNYTQEGKTAAQVAQERQHTKIVELLSQEEPETKPQKSQMPKLRLPIQWPSFKKIKLVIYDSTTIIYWYSHYTDY